MRLLTPTTSDETERRQEEARVNTDRRREYARRLLHRSFDSFQDAMLLRGRWAIFFRMPDGKISMRSST